MTSSSLTAATLPAPPCGVGETWAVTDTTPATAPPAGNPCSVTTGYKTAFLKKHLNLHHELAKLRLHQKRRG